MTKYEIALTNFSRTEKLTSISPLVVVFPSPSPVFVSFHLNRFFSLEPLLFLNAASALRCPAVNSILLFYSLPACFCSILGLSGPSVVSLSLGGCLRLFHRFFGYSLHTLDGIYVAHLTGLNEPLSFQGREKSVTLHKRIEGHSKQNWQPKVGQRIEVSPHPDVTKAV